MKRDIIRLIFLVLLTFAVGFDVGEQCMKGWQDSYHAKHPIIEQTSCPSIVPLDKMVSSSFVSADYADYFIDGTVFLAQCSNQSSDVWDRMHCSKRKAELQNRRRALRKEYPRTERSVEGEESKP